MKEYYMLPRSPELESHHQMQFSVIPRILNFGDECMELHICFMVLSFSLIGWAENFSVPPPNS